MIGLFQGMFENNILTFNQGWDENAQQVKGFEDIRKIQRRIKEKGMKFVSEADENGSGPAYLTPLLNYLRALIVKHKLTVLAARLQ